MHLNWLGLLGGDLQGNLPLPTVKPKAITFSKIQDINTARLLGRTTAGTGSPEEISLAGSLAFSGSSLQLSGDSATPGNSKLYGTDGSGTKGWFAQPAGGGWTLVAATANQAVINNSTLQNDDTLTFSVAASTRYLWRAQIYIDTTAAGDFKFDTNGPATPTSVRIWQMWINAGSTAVQQALDSAFNGGHSGAGTGAGGCYVHMWGMLINSTNAGSVTFRFAQNTATADTGAVRKAGSFLEWVSF